MAKCKHWEKVDERDEMGRYEWKCNAPKGFKCVGKNGCVIRKPKRMVRVKAWAEIQTVYDKNPQRTYKEVRKIDMAKDKCFVSVPCTILIDRKWLRGGVKCLPRKN